MIGKTLCYMRKQKKLTQTQIANNIGVARNTISQYENEVIQPTFETIEKIAKLCDYTIIFRNNKTNKAFSTENIKRKDI